MSSLIDNIRSYYEEDQVPPDASEIDYYSESADKTVEVSREVIDDYRWGDDIRIVYRRGDEFVAVEDVRPATEEQNWGDYGAPRIHAVRPVQVTVTKWIRVE